MHGQSGHNTRPQAKLPPSFLGMDAWMTLQVNVATLVIDVIGSYFWHVIHGYL